MSSDKEELESGAGGGNKVMKLEVGIKYCPGMETTLPPTSTVSTRLTAAEFGQTGT